MSFEGIGTLIGGAMLIYFAGPLLVAGTVALVAGGVTYAVVRAGIETVKALFSTYEHRQKQRDERLRRELKEIGGSLGEAAQKQNQRIQEILDRENEAYRKAVERRQREMEQFHERLAATADVEEAEQALQTALTGYRDAVDAVVGEEVTRFHDSLEQSCLEEQQTLAREIAERRREFDTKKQQIEQALDERQERYETYAREMSREGGRLLATLREQYDWKRFAPQSTERAERMELELKTLLQSGGFRNAATVAAEFEDQLLALQAELAWKTADYEHRKLCVDTALEELKAVREAAERFREDVQELAGEGKELEGYVTEDAGLEFWSEGRITGLYQRADRLMREAADFENRNTAVLTASIRRLTEEIRREHARARGFLANRVAVMKAAEHVLDSMEENGWELAEDAVYLNGDPRNDFVMVFTDASEDRRVVSICTEYEESTGRHLIRVARQAYDRRMPDEDKRRRDDQALNDSLERRGLAGMRVSCNEETRGMSGSSGGRPQ